MPISRDEAHALAELVCVTRPSWDKRGVVTRGLAPLANHPAPLEVIAWAALRAAANPDNLTPAVIPLNGHHWNLADRPETPRLTPEHECRTHPGKWAGNCPLCTVDHYGRDTDPPPAEQPVGKAAAIARAKAAAGRARDALADTGDDQAEHVHTWRPKADGTLHGKTRYRNTCHCGARQNPETDVPSEPDPVNTPTEGSTHE